MGRDKGSRARGGIMWNAPPGGLAVDAAGYVVLSDTQVGVRLS